MPSTEPAGQVHARGASDKRPGLQELEVKLEQQGTSSTPHPSAGDLSLIINIL